MREVEDQLPAHIQKEVILPDRMMLRALQKEDV